MDSQRYDLGCLAHASHMIADETTGIAAVIDLQRDNDQYLADAAEHGFQLKCVLPTHFHTDQITMKMKLAANGIRVIETSEDPFVVKLLQQHAKVVSRFIKNGFAEVHKTHTVPR